MNVQQYQSEIYSIGDSFFYDNRFNIPIYQRLYVWEDEQVNTLIEDLIRAYLHNEKHIYYLGGIVVVEKDGKQDLIDGQQRFTTLKILRSILGDSDLILEFSARENIWEGFNADAESEINLDIQRMQKAKKLLEIGLGKRYDETSIDREKFLNFLKEQVHLVVTKVPENTNLNKLFELINGRGEQLQEHEILKERLLSKIDQTQQEAYGKIWDICANMDELIEINIKKSIFTIEKEKSKNISWGQYFEKYRSFDIKQLIQYFQSKEQKQSRSQINHSENSIYHIIQKDIIDLSSTAFLEEPEEGIQYKAIISFPLLLLYVLVAYKKEAYFEVLAENKIEFKDKNLIKIFEVTFLKALSDKDEEVKKFICYLFEFRKLFDKWIIRNKKEDGDNSSDKNHQISEIKQSKEAKTIRKQIELLVGSRDLALLQSMLYHAHTRNTQEWIIPFVSNIKSNVADNLLLLKKIDDMLYSQIYTQDTVLQRSSSFHEEKYEINVSKILNYINPKAVIENYHHFSHYWFYKMDWIIWDLGDKMDKDFKFTARNSIEHISPQNPQDANIDRDKVNESHLHSFGNLTLISVSQNSSFGAGGFNKKMGDFKDKKIKNLKMSLIYDYEIWGDENCRKHLIKCLCLVKRYYRETS